MTTYVVMDEDSLGYLQEPLGPTTTFWPLAGYHDGKNGGVAAFGSKIRPALVGDFERFRVTIPPDFGLPKVQRCASSIANKECQFAGPKDKRGFTCAGSESKHAICTYSSWQKSITPSHVEQLGLGNKMP